MINVENICKNAKTGSYKLQKYSSDDRNRMLKLIADAIWHEKDEIIKQNLIDLENIPDSDKVFKDRLTLNDKRIEIMCDGLTQLIALPDPVGEVVEEWKTESGLDIKKVRASLGVIGVIYEARPNVTADVVGLCIKTSNAVVLRGGSNAIHSNRAIYQVIKNALEKGGFASDFIQFLDDTDRACSRELLKQDKYIDVIIPRGGDSLKKMVLSEATMPVIASAGGNCHTYIHESADIAKVIPVIMNAKIQRPTVCNATEQLVVDEAIADKILPALFESLRASGVTIKGDEKSLKIDTNIEKATENDYFTEFHDMIIAVKIVAGIDEAIAWINAHNTMHSDAILAEDKLAQEKFASEIDSGCIYINASTRFTDGYEFGFGAEIAISTQKLHARGPLGLRQLTSEKYVVKGDYTERK